MDAGLLKGWGWNCVEMCHVHACTKLWSCPLVSTSCTQAQKPLQCWWVRAKWIKASLAISRPQQMIADVGWYNIYGQTKNSAWLCRINLRPSGWAWFERSLWPHQSLNFGYHIKEVRLHMEGMGGCYMLKGPEENTVHYSIYVTEPPSYLGIQPADDFLWNPKP